MGELSMPHHTRDSAHRISLQESLLTLEEWEFVAHRLRLSRRQRQITELIVRAKKDKQIAAALGMNEWTLRSHITRVFNRLGIADRVELVVLVFGMVRKLERERTM
jgi:DNA-binding NarL/FixJ family response regulator